MTKILDKLTADVVPKWDWKNEYLTKSSIPPSALEIFDENGRNVIRVEPNGTIYWYDREVYTDALFRASVLEILKRCPR